MNCSIFVILYNIYTKTTTENTKMLQVFGPLKFNFEVGAVCCNRIIFKTFFFIKKKKRKWQTSSYYALPLFMDREPM